jgi:YD repeat-containing protein
MHGSTQPFAQISRRVAALLTISASLLVASEPAMANWPKDDEKNYCPSCTEFSNAETRPFTGNSSVDRYGLEQSYSVKDPEVGAPLVSEDHRRKTLVVTNCLTDDGDIGEMWLSFRREDTGTGHDGLYKCESNSQLTMDYTDASNWTVSHDNGFTITSSSGTIEVAHDGRVVREINSSGVSTSGDVTQDVTYDTKDRPQLIEDEKNSVPTSTTYFHYVEDTGGNLIRKRVTRKTFNSDGSQRLHTTIYVYYDSTATGDRPGNLHFIVPPEAVRAIAEDNSYEVGVVSGDLGGSSSLEDLTDAELDDYASVIFTDYDADGHVTEQVGSTSGCCGGGSSPDSYQFVYAEDNSAYPGTPSKLQKWTVWKTREGSVQMWDDGGSPEKTDRREMTFRNVYGSVVFNVRQVYDGSAYQFWVTHYVYDDEGNLLEVRHPSACDAAGYTVAQDGTNWPDDVTVPGTPTTNNGRVDVYTYTTYGDRDYRTAVKVRKGVGGTEYWVKKYEYGAAGQSTVSGKTVYRVTEEYSFPTEQTSGTASDRLLTSYDYEFYSGSHDVKFKEVTLPAVATAKNGSGSSNTMVYHYARNTAKQHYYNDWTQHEDGSLSYTHVDEDTGLTEYSITAVKTDGSGYADTDGDGSIETNGDDEQAPLDPWDAIRWTDLNGIHLKTTYTHDTRGRTETVTGPGGQKRVMAYVSQEESHFDGTTGDTYLNTTTTGTLSTPHMDSLDDYDYVPVNISISDMDGRSIISAAGIPSSDEDGDLTNDWDKTDADIEDAFNGTLVRRTETTYNDEGQVWKVERFSKPEDAITTEKLTTSYTYYDDTDSHPGKLKFVTGEDGTVTQQEYDKAGRLSETKMGKDDTSLVTVSITLYDEGTVSSPIVVGDGNVTETRSYFGSNADDYYATKSQYDWRNRMTRTRGADKMATYRDLDNLGRATATERYYDSDTDFDIDNGERVGKSTAEFDEMGQVWKSTVYEIDSSGATDHSLTTEFWHDERGQRIKTKDPNGLFNKTEYDTAGRPIYSYICYDDTNGDEEGGNAYDGAGTVDGDTVIEQTNYLYNDKNQWVMTTNLSRHYNDTTSTGALSPNKTSAFYTVSVTWHDEVGRATHFGDYGQDGVEGGTEYIYNSTTGLVDADSDGIPDEAENTAREPNDATHKAYIRVTKRIVTWNTSSPYMVVTTTANNGVVNRTEYDGYGRPIKVYENYVDGVVLETEANDEDRLTEREYNLAGQLATLIAYNPKGSGNGVEQQKTRYVYSNSVHNSWVTNVIYPESTSTVSQDGTTRAWSISAGSDHVTYGRDRTGRVTSLTDQRGVVRAFAYNNPGSGDNGQAQHAGLLKSDGVLSYFGTGIDATVLRIEYDYDDRNRRSAVTSYSAYSGGYELNQVKFTYTDGNGHYGALTKSQQEHDGAVDGSTEEITYTYDDGTTGLASDSKYLRLESMTYPSGHVVHYDYGAAASTDDILSRVYRIRETDASGDIYAEYSHVGAGQVAVTDYPEPDLRNAMHGDTADDVYDALDRFGALANQNWYDYGAAADAVDLKYGYDAVGMNIYREDVVAGSINPNAVHIDEQYFRDDLSRLYRTEYGAMNSSGEVVFNMDYEQTTIDHLGNSISVLQEFNADYGGSDDPDQDRTHNAANEITDLAAASGAPATSNWVDPEYDAAGNMTVRPNPADPDDASDAFEHKFDAWNRLTKVLDESTGNPLIVYEYDGLNRRIRKVLDTDSNNFINGFDDARHYYYSAQWQVVEEADDSFTVDKRFIWGKRYIDDLVARERDSGSGFVRKYVLQDRLWNVVALAATDGTINERYRYTSSGERVIMTAAFDADDDNDGNWKNNASAYDLNCGSQGLWHEEITKLVLNRERFRCPLLTVFLSRDKKLYVDGMSLYATYNLYLGALDPYGEDFIAVADRPVGHRFNILAYHYSLQYWVCPCELADFDEDKEYTVKEIQKLCPGAKKAGSVELLAETGWNAWYYYKDWTLRLKPIGVPKEDSVWISVIYYSDRGTKILPIYSDPNPKVVKEKWDLIIKNAKKYPWAEQEQPAGAPFTGPFRNWPKSHYKSWGTNSNTFVREMVRQAGLRMTEMKGSHPGDDHASQNNNRDLLFHSWAPVQPWQDGAPKTPKPGRINR